MDEFPSEIRGRGAVNWLIVLLNIPLLLLWWTIPVTVSLILMTFSQKILRSKFFYVCIFLFILFFVSYYVEEGFKIGGSFGDALQGAFILLACIIHFSTLAILVKRRGTNQVSSPSEAMILIFSILIIFPLLYILLAWN